MTKDCEGKKDGTSRSIELPVLNDVPQLSGKVRKSETARWRAGALIALNVLMIAHVIQWWISGSTISPIEPSESMYTLQNGAVNAGFIFFTLAILATLVFGRFVCGWGCHIIALQDLCAWILKKIGLRPRPFRSRLLVYVPLVFAVYMFIWPSVFRFIATEGSQPLIPEFTNHLVTTDFWATFPPAAVAIPFLFICGFVTVYFLGSKGFCTYACPYGGFFGVADKIAPGRIRVTDDCNQCGHCTATCTSNVLVHKEVREHKMVVDPGCMKCMDCVSVCPNDALYFGFGKPAVSVRKPAAKNFPLTWPEEIGGIAVFFGSFFAVWDVYQLVPMLMALGIASVSAFLSLRMWKLVRARELSFYKFQLKSAGAITAAGIAFTAFAGLWIALNIHSGWIRYHEWIGTRAYEQVRVPDELALAQADPGRWLNPEDRKNVESGRSALRTAASRGLFVNAAALPKLAWLEFLSNDPDAAIKDLSRAARLQHGEAKALSLYYKGAILNRQGRYGEALSSLDEALSERPDLTFARIEKGESLWLSGKRKEAIESWTEATKANDRIALANDFLSGAYADLGDRQRAASFEAQADKNTPDDALFHFMLGLRLRNLGMRALAGKHFETAFRLNPSLRNLNGK